MTNLIQLEGRVIFSFDIVAETGLHIGGSDTKISIGGVDKTVIRDPLTNRPYIPGSSLKGKMRSLLEKYHGLEQNQRIDKVHIHSCGNKDDNISSQTYLDCPVCSVFGVSGDYKFATPTRLIVRDTMLDKGSVNALEGKTDLPYSEVKTEVSIDRVTSAANPRQMERVPAGAVFGPAEIIYSIYSGDGLDPEKDLQHLKSVVEGLALVEDDYLGGLGSRGSGKVKFTNIEITFRPSEHYIEEAQKLGEYEKVQDLADALPNLQTKIRSTVIA